MHRKFIGLILIVGFLTFANCLVNDFVGDDEVLIVHNSFYDRWQNFPRLFQKDYITQSDVLFEKKSGDFHSGSVAYRPVLSATYFLDHSVWQKNPFGYHLTSVLLHILNSLLVYCLIYALVQNSGVAVFSALLFCVHPLKAEPISAIAYRHDALAAFFVLLSTLCFIKFVQIQKYGRYLVGAAMFYLLAVFSKESAVVLPILFLVYDRYFSTSKMNWRAHSILGVLFLVYIWIYYVVFPNSTLGHNPLLGTSWLEHWGASCRIFVDYVGLLVNPLAVKTFPPLYAPPLESLGSWRTMSGVAIILVFIISAWRLFRYDRALSFFLLWFLVMFLPVSNIIPLANPMAHRFLYLPSIGFLAAVGILFNKLFLRTKIMKDNPRLMILFMTFVIGINMVLTVFLNSCWRSNYTFARSVVAAYPENPKAYSILGIVYFSAGMCPDATEALNRALKLGSNDPRAYYFLGACEENTDRAKDYFETAIARLPQYAPPYLGLGKIYFNRDEYQQALTYFQRGTKLELSLVGFAYLIKTYKKLGQPEKAQEVLEDAKRELKNSKQIIFLHDILVENLSMQPKEK